MPQTEQQRQAAFQAAGVPQPAAQAPVTPVPQQNTPPAPAPYTNPNANTQVPQGTPPVQVNVGTAPQGTSATQQGQPTSQQATKPLAMPASGSVVDLLNAAGQDSSFAARQKLAQQYGMQGYTGTASQNMDLSKKYLDAYNANKALPVPQSSADASKALDTYFKDTAQEPQQDPQKSFFDEYMAMNPVIKTMYDAINHELSAPTTFTSFKDEFAKLQQEQGIPALNTELMNIKNIMDGTEDDIRTEISKAGGFATESQVQALKGARNKTLLKQANVLQQQLAIKNDYVDQLMQFSKMDRDQVDNEVERKLGLTEKLAKIQESMTTAARENYQNIVDKLGYDGLAKAVSGDVRSQRMAESYLGLPPGSLSDSTFLMESSLLYDKEAPAIVNEYKFAQSQGYAGSFEQYQNEDANRKKAVTNVNVGGLTPGQMLTAASGLRDDVRADPDIKDFIAIRDGYDRIKAGSNMDSGPGDLAIIFGYMKMLDPTSVVREQEFNNAEQAVGVLQKYQNIPSKYVKGTRLTKEGRAFFASAAEQLYKAKKANYDKAIGFYNSTAEAYGVDPKLITRDFSTQKSVTNINDLKAGSYQVVPVNAQKINFGALTLKK